MAYLTINELTNELDVATRAFDRATNHYRLAPSELDVLAKRIEDARNELAIAKAARRRAIRPNKPVRFVSIM